MKNLLTETLEQLYSKGYTPDDVLVIANDEGQQVDWRYFTIVADRDYDEKYGLVYVNDIVIYMNDGSTFYRVEYDGYERWKYRPFRFTETLTDVKDIERFVWDKEARP